MNPPFEMSWSAADALPLLRNYWLLSSGASPLVLAPSTIPSDFLVGSCLRWSISNLKSCPVSDVGLGMRFSKNWRAPSKSAKNVNQVVKQSVEWESKMHLLCIVVRLNIRIRIFGGCGVSQFSLL